MTLNNALPVSSLTGVGPRIAEKLARIGIRYVQDLLFHLPYRYQDRTHVRPISSLQLGDEAAIEAEVIDSQVVFHKRRMLLVDIGDKTGTLLLRFFHFTAAMQKVLSKSGRIRSFGEVRQGPTGLEMVHPELQVLSDDIPQLDNEHLTPIYSTTEGLHQISLRKLTDQALAWLKSPQNQLNDWLPRDYLRGDLAYQLDEALQFVHRPPADADVERLEAGRHPARLRLAFEELLAHQLSLIRLRIRVQRQRAVELRAAGDLVRKFIARLPFSLTRAQASVIQQITQDLSMRHPMQRLVQGDVGSGKTVVAAAACLHAVEAGFQAVLMAPTEILAEQHYRSFLKWLEPLDVSVVWLTGKQKAEERRLFLERLMLGENACFVPRRGRIQKSCLGRHRRAAQIWGTPKTSITRKRFTGGHLSPSAHYDGYPHSSYFSDDCLCRFRPLSDRRTAPRKVTHQNSRVAE